MSPERWFSIRCVLLAAVMSLPLDAVRADLNDEAVNRCMLEVGEFGVGMVQTCVEQDVAAAKALATYPRAAREAVAACTDVFKGRGWSMVKSCADREIEADRALATLEKEHASEVARCQQRLGAQGAAKIKECVDGELSSGAKQ
jgi:hypothetical protein